MIVRAFLAIAAACGAASAAFTGLGGIRSEGAGESKPCKDGEQGTRLD